ncbi:unnamed protein product [Phyllotreta striolata]|uniref:Major facilitator superfamily (MFS) profile domain-containing protein n=1 Tax=Phyllotreta striolata TaxID=444603 RepID=A0A9N9TGY0_PHYSR|nr:unnamed protein product [Phyllotreta striolata]
MDDNLIDLDSMLSQVGDFGRAQIILMVLFSFINILSAFHYFGQTFISIVPKHTCNYEICCDRNVTINSCDVVYLQNNDTHISEPCVSGWKYNNTQSFGFIGIIQELNWVCNDDWKPALGQSVFFIGSVIGSLVLGVIADIIGRLHVLVIANSLAFVGNISTILSKDVATFAISRFLAGLATDTNFFMMYIIVMEYMRPSHRTLGLNLCIGIFYSLACVIVPWTAVLLKTWKNFLIFVSVPHLLVIFFYLIVPESAQWLISKGKTERAINCFKQIAKINGRHVDDKAYENLREYCKQYVNASEQHESLWGLLKTPKLRKKTLILIFKSMVMTLAYDAISRNINGLDYSPFVIFSVGSTTIFPACLFILAVQDRVGRKALASSFLLFTGIFTVCSGIIQALVSNPSPPLIITLEVIARLAITVAYNSGAQYAVELIPAVVRGQGVSAIHVTGYAASFFSPQILYLAQIWQPAPGIILGVLLTLGAAACLFLPETLNRTLPVTLRDGEEFGEDEGIFEFACCRVTTESTATLYRSDAS